MQDWVATTLRSVQLFAVENGFDDLANEMDVAILVAAQEHHKRIKAQLEGANVRRSERDSGEVVQYARPAWAGRGN